jgi:putative transposase
MGRAHRAAEGGYVYHVLNRANARMTIFRNRWLRGSVEDRELLATWPQPRKPSWTDYVNQPQTEAELAAIRRSLRRGSPFGDDQWITRTADKLDLETTLRSRGRPKIAEKGS